MTIADFAWSNGLIGGALIGFSAVFMMATIGRITGISGIVANTLKPASSLPWHWTFIAGLLCSGLIFHWMYRPIVLELNSSTPLLIVAGLLVGFGTRLGSGCTSGHGVCGISRLSLRSIVATVTFIGSGILTVFLLRLTLGGI